MLAGRSDNRQLSMGDFDQKGGAIMQRDAKFGLVMGVVLVLVIAVVFSRQEAATSAPHPTEPTVSTSKISGEPHESRPEVAAADVTH